MGHVSRTRRAARGRAVALAASGAVGAIVLAALSTGPSGTARPAAAQAAPYVVPVANGGFESPDLSAGAQVTRPTNTGWTFSDIAGVATPGANISAGAPAFPEGDQVGFVRNSSKLVQRLWLEPGDQIRFQATQGGATRTGLLSLAVHIDGVRQGEGVTPGDGTWTEHTVALTVASPRRAYVEIRGLTLASTETRAALLDVVEILRVPVTIPDSGIAALQQRGILDPRPQVLQAGVVGELYEGDSEPRVNTPVQAIVQVGSRIIVGGKFARVQRGEGAPLIEQSYLAAFDRVTGAWIDTFRPQLDGTVWDLAVADGKLFVAGQFTNVNGVARTAGLAALDPDTGAVVPDWRAGLLLARGSARPFARAIDVSGKVIFVGGRFNRVTQGSGTVVPVQNLTRVSVASGGVSLDFTPSVNGQIYDIDVAAGRVYAVGKFTQVNGVPRRGLAVVDVAAGDSIPGLAPLEFSSMNTKLQYQQAVLALGPSVWIGGSQHHTQQYATADFTRLKSFISRPQGDIQAFAMIDGYLYAGSHANPGTFLYTDATTNTGLTGWTTRDPVRWIAAIDLTTRSHVPAWSPQVGTHNGEGAWDLFVDSESCLWAGGDFKRGAFIGDTARYAQGFVKFCPVDSVAPSVPPTPAVTLTPGGSRLTWGASTDDRAGGLRYDIFRNDRMIAEGVALRTFDDPAGRTGDRYFIRSSDLASNRSATTTAIVVPADTTPPKTPQGLTVEVDGQTVTLRWTAPTDNVGVAEYLVYDNPDVIATVTATSVVLENLAPGSYSFAVRARDAAGNQGNKTSPINQTIS
jgi:hypothetical protein